MQRGAIEEFYSELDATDETFVRKKYRQRGYAGWKVKHVKQWLDAKADQRAAQRAETVAFWTKFGAIGTLGAMLVAAIALWLR